MQTLPQRRPEDRTPLHAITQLASIDTLEKIRALNALGIFTIRDMAEYAPCRHAALLVDLAARGQLDDATWRNYVEAPLGTGAVAETPIELLVALRASDGQRLAQAFGIGSLGQLAAFAPTLEARRLVEQSIRGPFYERPSAPAALVPQPIGSTHSQVRFSNYVREHDLQFRDHELAFFADGDEPAPSPLLIDIFYRARARFHLGYLASISQKWVKQGTHLGDIVHSLALAPGESRNIAVLEWFRRQQSSRTEDTSASEQMASEFTQTRALNEVVQTTAQEHLVGSTEVDSSTSTTGVGATAGVGGGGSAGASVSLPIPVEGIPVQVGLGLLGSLAGSLGASAVHSNGKTQGTLKSETSAERSVLGEVTQNIADATVQNASNVRSLMATVVVEDQQSGTQRAQTRNVTNYNHSHALTVQYYEVLQSYRVLTAVDSVSPMLMLPFGPIDFDIRIVQSYWHLLRNVVQQALPGRFEQWDAVVRDFDPANNAFDPAGELRLSNIRITRSRSYTQPLEVAPPSQPGSTVPVSGFALDGVLALRLEAPQTLLAYLPLAITAYERSDFLGADAVPIDRSLALKLEAPAASFKEAVLRELMGKNSLVADTIVSTGLFQVNNDQEGVQLALAIEYTVLDRNGQQQRIKQDIERFYSYRQLLGGVEETAAELGRYVRAYLERGGRFNPINVIEEIEQHFRFHKYAYTKLLLAGIEKEQIIDIVEHLGLAGDGEVVPLAALVDPNPLGVTENLLIFRLREQGRSAPGEMAESFFARLELGLALRAGEEAFAGRGTRREVMRQGSSAWRYEFSGLGLPVPDGSGSLGDSVEVVFYLSGGEQPGKAPAVSGTLTRISKTSGIGQRTSLAFTGTATRTGSDELNIVLTSDSSMPGAPGAPGSPGLPGARVVSLGWHFTFPEPAGESPREAVVRYARGLREYEQEARRLVRTSEVFLPSSGVFAEAILGQSNASEVLDISRFFNWQDSPIPNLAPAVQPVNVNQDFSRPPAEGLQPNVPVSVLNQISPLQYAPPTSLGAALQALQSPMFTDMSKTDSLVSILGGLANLAQSSAQLAGNLSGEAGANALNGAVQLGQQVAGLVGTAMTSNLPRPPGNLTERGVIGNQMQQLEDRSGGGPLSPVDEAVAKNVLGSPVDNGSGGSSGGSGSGGGGSGGGTPAPAPSPAPAPPARNTSNSVAGKFIVKVALPAPYKLAVLNSLAELDAAVPDSVDASALETYRALKALISPTPLNDEVKAGQMAVVIGQLSGLLKGGGALGAVLAVADLLTSQQTLEVIEGTLKLLYDTTYAFAFPYLEFSGAHEPGVWMQCEVEYAKTKGQTATVGGRNSAPYNSVNYYVGGQPTPAEPADAWGVESLAGGAWLAARTTPAGNLTLSHLDLADGEGLVIQLRSLQGLLPSHAHLIESARRRFNAGVLQVLANAEAAATTALEQAIDGWLAGLGEETLAALLDHFELGAVIQEAVLAAWRAGISVLSTLATYAVSAARIVTILAGLVLETVLLTPGLIATLVPFKCELNLDLELRYQNAFPQGWTVQPRGNKSAFPELSVTHLPSTGGGEKTVLAPRAANSRGLLGLLMPLETIPSPTLNL